MTVEQNEVNYTLNLLIADKTISDLTRIEASMMQIAANLNRVFPNKTAAQIEKQITRLIQLLQQTYATAQAVEAALIPGAGIAKMVGAGAMVSSLSVNMMAQTQSGGV